MRSTPSPLTLSLSKGEPLMVRQAHHERRISSHSCCAAPLLGKTAGSTELASAEINGKVGAAEKARREFPSTTSPLTLSLSKGEPPMVRQAHHERSIIPTVF